MNLRRKKVVEIFELLSSDELLRLGEYVQSPYFVKQQNREVFLRIFHLLSGLPNGATTQEINENVLFEKLFPNEPFVSGRIDKKFSQFTSIVLNFIGQEEVEKGNAVELGTLKFLRTRGEAKLYGKEFKKIKKKIIGNGKILLDEPMVNFEIDLEECRFTNLDLYRINQESFDQVYESLDNFYIYYFIYLGIRNLAYNNFTKPGDNAAHFDSLLVMMEKRSVDEKTPPQLFAENLFKILINAPLVENDKIEELSRQLEDIKVKLHQDDYKNYRTIIRSFILAKYNSGEHRLGPIIFNIYKSELENGSIFFEGKISSAAVNNVCMAALREKETEWLDDFLAEIEGKIMETNLEKFTIALNRSRLLFVQEKYETVLDMLIFEVKEMYLKVYARALELMAYYELDSEQLTHKIEAYKLFIFRIPKTKMGAGFIEGHHNFIRFLRSISHTSTIYDLKRIRRLQKKVSETKILAEKQWLLEKLAVLEKKNI